MITEKREKQILMMSFLSGLAFAVVEFIFPYTATPSLH